MSFPEKSVWGAAAASYQIEGASTADDRGESVWDMFCRKPGAIWSGHDGSVACDHYHRYAEDVAIMRDIFAEGEFRLVRLTAESATLRHRSSGKDVTVPVGKVPGK